MTTTTRSPDNYVDPLERPQQSANVLPPFFFHQTDLDNFILVYTIGKVGSTALVRSLEATNIVCRHLHCLQPQTEAFLEKLQARPNSIFHFLNNLNRARAHHALRNRDYAEILKVITVVRTPIDQILSHYFQSTAYQRYALRRNKPLNAETIIDSVLEGAEFFLARPERTLSDLIHEKTDENGHAVFFSWIARNYLTWFDFEFLPFFPSPILGGQMTDGYQLAGNAMILKFEELRNNGERAIAGYAQRPHFKLLTANVSAEKEDGDLYREVKEAIKFPKAFVDYLCDSKYVHHFYSEDERKAHKRRWTG